MRQVCQGCRRLHDITYTDEADRSFCAECVALQPTSTALPFLEFLAATVPYQVGDVVSCKTGGQIYDGIGHITKISFSPEDLASPVVPMFEVEMDKKAYPEMVDKCWYSETCLERVVESADK